MIDSTYCINDTIKVFNNLECSQYFRFSFNDSKLSNWDLDSIEYIAGEIGLNKITERIQKYHIKFEDSISYYFYVIYNPEKPTISKSNDTLYSSSDNGNQWYLENIMIEGATGKSHYPLYIGNYTVKAAEGKCESEVSDKYYVDAVGVENNEKQDDYLIPNPASDYIEINSVILNEVKDPVIKIYDVLGIEHPATAWHPSAEGNVRIDVSQLSPGVYFVKVGGKVSKFVKI